MRLAFLKAVPVLALIAATAHSEEIERKFSFSADLTRDGREESIVLEVHGPAMEKPFRWTITVSDHDGRSLFKTEGEDSEFDEFFGEDGFTGGCDGYSQCKSIYYFEDQPASIAQCLKPGYTTQLAKQVGLENSLLATRLFLEEGRASSAITTAALKEMPAALQNKDAKSLCFQIHPNDHGQHLVWLAAVNEFVPYLAH